MALNPRVLTAEITVTWDGGQQVIPAGTVIDIPAGSTLEAAYGLSNLVPVTALNQGGDPIGGNEVAGNA